MDWTDDGIVLTARRHGESAAIATLLTRDHGRHAGLLRGGGSRRHRGMLQPGNRVAAVWRARLDEHLGSFALELTESIAARLLDHAGRLAALASACALIEAGLPEREPHPALYETTLALLAALDSERWAEAYIGWELGLLGELGYGLDLARCAATGSTEDLAYVSPKTGRAVSRAAGEGYRDRLLPLPGFLAGQGDVDAAALTAGLRLTGYFLDRHLLRPQGASMPDVRARLAERVSRGAL
ncbi:MAG: DNA repair protein RecO [Alphaproteobacteria bacterium]